MFLYIFKYMYSGSHEKYTREKGPEETVGGQGVTLWAADEAEVRR